MKVIRLSTVALQSAQGGVVRTEGMAASVPVDKRQVMTWRRARVSPCHQGVLA